MQTGKFFTQRNTFVHDFFRTHVAEYIKHIDKDEE
jgi:hypothetical protein